jgi:hypothetical protein
MSWHPTRRDIFLFLIILVLFGLFLQLDFSFRFTDSKGADSLLGFKLGIGGGRPPGDRDSGRSQPPADLGLSVGKAVGVVSDSKVRWGDEGAVRSTVPAHAPGENRALGRVANI